MCIDTKIPRVRPEPPKPPPAAETLKIARETKPRQRIGRQALTIPAAPVNVPSAAGVNTR